MNDVVIIGAGIVGLSTAYKLLQKKPFLKIHIVEKENTFAMHQTGHNSGVIHAGIYYKPGTLKAQNCIRGYAELISFCDEHTIPYNLCGKVIVATEKRELPILEIIFQRGIANGLSAIRELTKEELLEKEPYCNGIKAIHVPYTGIVDYTKVSKALADEIQKKDGLFTYNSKVTSLKHKNTFVEIITQKETLMAKIVVNCGGLYSDTITDMIEKQRDIQIIPFRGEYYKIKDARKYLVKNLIYPVPNPNFPFLGVHFTRKINGEVEAGPNAVLAFAREGYSKTDIHMSEFLAIIRWGGFQKIALKYWKTGIGEMYRSFSKQAFTRALQKLVPDIQASDLEVGGAGVRAQACHRNGTLLDDFFIQENTFSVNVCNAPSPAATSSLSIGDYIARMVLSKL
ncbi:MAG: L-2-hydroxyglutarate oxidase [Chitinophagaceae bacterium]|nr:L-2-hydroxyglutarate oxidase [Chitinophagaceae bacterium]